MKKLFKKLVVLKDKSLHQCANIKYVFMDINIQRWTCNLVSLMWMHHLKCYAFHFLSLSSLPFGSFPLFKFVTKITI